VQVVQSEQTKEKQGEEKKGKQDKKNKRVVCV
jgi:hypothetical protein